MFDNKLFSSRLTALRRSEKLTLERLGEVLGVSKQTASRWETGDRLPSLDTAYEIARYFNVTLDYLVGLSDVKVDRPPCLKLREYIDENEKELHEIYENLHDYERGMLLERARIIANPIMRPPGLKR